MSDTEIIAYHGWGFDAQCWHTLQEELAIEVSWRNFDRGYFGNKQSHRFSDESAKTIVTHSFGLHHCPAAQLEKADMLIVIAGFLHFHPRAAQFRRRSKLVLKEMISRFKEEPENVIKAFYRNVYHPHKTFHLPEKALNKDVLLHDLIKLDESEIALPDLKKTARVCILQGTDDAIVPKEKSRGLFEQFGKKAQYFEIKNAGHALPFTHAGKCATILKQIIETERVND